MLHLSQQGISGTVDRRKGDRWDRVMHGLQLQRKEKAWAQRLREKLLLSVIRGGGGQRTDKEKGKRYGTGKKDISNDSLL